MSKTCQRCAYGEPGAAGLCRVCLDVLLRCGGLREWFK